LETLFDTALLTKPYASRQTRLLIMTTRINSTYLDIDVDDDWGFYIDIEADDWNQSGASAPIKIQVNPIPNESTNNGKRTHPPTNDEIQRLIKLSSPKEEYDPRMRITRFNLNIPKTIAITVVVAAVCAFY
jgi:hypothetical protein